MQFIPGKKCSKRLRRLYSTAREDITRLKRMLSNVESKNQGLFIETACSIHQKMSEIQGMTENGSEASFNDLLASMHKRDLIGTCNYFLANRIVIPEEKLLEPMQFSFDFFPGPIQEAEKARRLLEEEEQRQSYFHKAHERRKPLGLYQHLLGKIPRWMRHVIFGFLTTPHPDEGEFLECSEQKKNYGTLYEVFEMLMTEQGHKKVSDEKEQARKCMKSTDGGCKTCLTLSLCFQITDGLDTLDNDQRLPYLSSSLYDAFLWTIFRTSGFNHCVLFLKTYMEKLEIHDDPNTCDFSLGESELTIFRNLTSPNVRHAVENPSSSLAEEFVDALKDYSKPLTTTEIEEKETYYSHIISDWKRRYLDSKFDRLFESDQLKCQSKPKK